MLIIIPVTIPQSQSSFANKHGSNYDTFKMLLQQGGINNQTNKEQEQQTQQKNTRVIKSEVSAGSQLRKQCTLNVHKSIHLKLMKDTYPIEELRIYE